MITIMIRKWKTDERSDIWYILMKPGVAQIFLCLMEVENQASNTDHHDKKNQEIQKYNPPSVSLGFSLEGSKRIFYYDKV